MVSIRDEIKSLRERIDRLYNIVRDLEDKQKSLDTRFENKVAHQESEKRTNA